MFKELIEANEPMIGEGLQELEDKILKYLKIQSKREDGFGLVASNIVTTIRMSLKKSGMDSKAIKAFVEGFNTTDVKP